MSHGCGRLQEWRGGSSTRNPPRAQPPTWTQPRETAWALLSWGANQPQGFGIIWEMEGRWAVPRVPHPIG